MSIRQNTPHKIEKGKSGPNRLDVYGDPLPAGAMARLGTTRLRGASNQPVLFTPDGKAFLFCAPQGPAQLCEAPTGRVLRRFGKDVRGIALSRDGRILASHSPDNHGGLCLWELATGNLLQQILTGPIDWHVGPALSPDGKTVASTVAQFKTLVYNISTGKMLWDEKNFKGLANIAGQTTIAYSHDGKYLLIPDAQRGVQVLDALTGKELRSIGESKDGKIIAWACSPDAKLAAVSYQRIQDPKLPQGKKPDKRPTEITTTLWDVATGKELRPAGPGIQQDHPVGLAFSPDGKVLATADDHEGRIRLSDVITGKEIRRCDKYIGRICGLTFSPNGKFIAAVNSHWRDFVVRLWSAETGKEVTPSCDGHTSFVTSLAFTPDGETVVSGGYDGVLRTWNASTGAERLRLGQVAALRVPLPTFGSVAPDGSMAAFIDTTCLDDRPDGCTLTIMRRAGGLNKEAARILLCLQMGYFLHFSPHSKLLALSGAGDKNVRLWNVLAGKELPGVPGRAMAMSPDGCTVATRATAGTAISIWDIRTGRELCSIRAGEDDQRKRLTAAAFSPTERLLAITDEEGAIQLWCLDRDDGSRLRSRQFQVIKGLANSEEPFKPLAFSPDGRMLAVGDMNNVVHVLETATGRQRQQFKGHDREVLSLAFSPDGLRLASGSADTSILVWDVTGVGLDANGKLLPCQPTRHEMEAFWGDLISDDEQRAARAVWILTAAGESTVSLIKSHLRPAPHQSIDRNVVAQCIVDLDAGEFVTRDEARRKLAAMGAAIETDLRQALRGKCSVEKRAALSRLLRAIEEGSFNAYKEGQGGEGLRNIRAIEVLGHIATPEAKALLQELAGGAPGASKTQRAKSALEKLTS